MSLDGGRDGGKGVEGGEGEGRVGEWREGRGGEGRVREGRGGEGRGGRGGMTVIHIAPQYINSNYVTYYVITCKSEFEWV